MMKCVSILGSTGSIGRQSLEVIDKLGITVVALTAGSSVELMAEQCRKYMPKLAVMSTQEAAERLQMLIRDLPIRISWGEDGLIEAATLPEMDCVITTSEQVLFPEKAQPDHSQALSAVQQFPVMTVLLQQERVPQILLSYT